jgi:hypothetical protein
MPENSGLAALHARGVRRRFAICGTHRYRHGLSSKLEDFRMSLKLAILTAAVITCSTSAFAQGGVGAGGGAGGGAGAASSGASGSTSGQQSGNQNQNQQGAQDSSGPAAVQNAETGANTKSMDPSSGVVSAPGVGVGHTANGQTIGSPGSGPGSPEQPIDGRNLDHKSDTPQR